MNCKIPLLSFSFLCLIICNAQVGVGTKNPDISAALEISANNKGLLTPRMTLAQRDAIVSPAKGLIIFCTDCDSNGTLMINMSEGSSDWKQLVLDTPEATHCSGTATSVVEVTSSTGKVWMDRNLGASQVAANKSDLNAYGDLYQWGRTTDGHQCRNSQTSSSLSMDDTVNSSNFITGSNDWRTPTNDFLWQGTNGLNNPCPEGFRIPTIAEWEEEMATWSPAGEDGAFSSALKLPLAGKRDASSGTISDENVIGQYWSNSVYYNQPNASLTISFSGTSSNTPISFKSNGQSVRCIKN